MHNPHLFPTEPQIARNFIYKQKRLVIIMIINLSVAGRGYDPRTSGL